MSLADSGVGSTVVSKRSSVAGEDVFFSRVGVFESLTIASVIPSMVIDACPATDMSIVMPR